MDRASPRQSPAAGKSRMFPRAAVGSLHGASGSRQVGCSIHVAPRCPVDRAPEQPSPACSMERVHGTAFAGPRDNDWRRVERPDGVGVTASALAAAALYSVPAGVWGLIAHPPGGDVRLRRPRSLGFRMLPLVALAFAAHYTLLLALTLAPLGLHDDPSRSAQPPIAVVWEGSWLVVVALLRHLLRLLPIPERRPSSGWL